jgi:hypothetical protein
MPELSLGDQLSRRADGVLDRCVALDAVLVVDVDVVRAETTKRALDRDAYIVGLLSSVPGPLPVCEVIPNFVASTTFSRWPLRARPTSSSLVLGQRISAVSIGLPRVRSSGGWCGTDSASSLLAPLASIIAPRWVAARNTPQHLYGTMPSSGGKSRSGLLAISPLKGRTIDGAEPNPCHIRRSA